MRSAVLLLDHPACCVHPARLLMLPVMQRSPPSSFASAPPPASRRAARAPDACPAGGRTLRRPRAAPGRAGVGGTGWTEAVAAKGRWLRGEGQLGRAERPTIHASVVRRGVQCLDGPSTEAFQTSAAGSSPQHAVTPSAAGQCTGRLCTLQKYSRRYFVAGFSYPVPYSLRLYP